jgi:hypothetical protein
MPLLAVVNRTDDLSVVDLTAEGRQVCYEAPGVRWPVWLPGTRSIAHSASLDGRPAVHVRDLAGDPVTPVTIFENEPGIDAVLGPGTPHYLAPSPAGDAIAVVAPSQEGMTATFIRVATGDVVARVSGAPLFPAFSPDGRYAAVHAGNDLVVVDTASGARRDVVSGDAMGFRSPAVGRDGELAYVARNGRALALSWTTMEGGGWAPGPVFFGGAVASFRPRSTELWLGSRPIGSSGLLSRLSVARYASPQRERIYRGPFTAFSWSPSGRHLVLAVPRQPGDDRTALVAIDETGGVLAECETFLPSDDQRALWAFFDQYALSHSSWLTMGDDELFVVSGRPGTDRVSPTLGASAGNRILAWRPARSEPLVDICAGEIAIPAPAGTYL